MSRPTGQMKDGDGMVVAGFIITDGGEEEEEVDVTPLLSRPRRNFRASVCEEALGRGRVYTGTSTPVPTGSASGSGTGPGLRVGTWAPPRDGRDRAKCWNGNNAAFEWDGSLVFLTIYVFGMPINATLLLHFWENSAKSNLFCMITTTGTTDVCIFGRVLDSAPIVCGLEVTQANLESAADGRTHERLSGRDEQIDHEASHNPKEAIAVYFLYPVSKPTRLSHIP
ncbi:hypothetical protein EYF80_019164 [Liparis tanakae]|uniref:Uncharacterized protein n=1 Tax=Liparis tanakae TaxID=230148 RepID=A0A4Z2HYG5_9TELE|nr:hypothetical protein EYF80_019164 [Liparis tanakae]